MNQIKRLQDYLNTLAISIYSGDRLERNLRVISWIGGVIAVIGGIMTVFNVVQQKGFVTYTTAAACLSGLIITFSGTVLKKRKPAVLAALFVCLFIFTYYALFGVNDGFAILWTFLVPLAISYFAGVIYGVILSVYYEVLFIVLFYTPIRSIMEQFYSVTFMDRFPMLYLCGVLLNSVAMIHYHATTLAQIEYEKKLKEAADEAIAAGMAKSQFLAQMSHEIRTPINAVLGMNEMILREAKDEAILDYSENIRESGRTLLALINSILDFSKIEDGKMEIIPVKYSTMTMIHNLVASVSERARTKELALIIDTEESIPAVLFGDDVRITQVVSNLLTNAVKYTEKGSVTLTVREKGRKDGVVDLYFCVKDTGIGIREEDRDKLFESFERLEEKRNRNIEGTGLGMAIVTRLLGLMGSEIELESEYGKGSAFSFVIRQEIVDVRPMGKYQESSVKQREEKQTEHYLFAPDAKVLVTDDNAMNLKVVRHLLKRCGVVPDLASSGMETIEKIRENSYDIVFLDHMMPKMDGLETLQKLREEGLLKQEMTVIALTANAVVGAKEQYLEAGFDDYLSKPIDVAGLEGKLEKYLPKELITWKECGEQKTEEKQDEILEFEPQTEEKVSETSDHALRQLENAGLDVSKGLMFCSEDEDFYLEMVRDYVHNGPGQLKELEAFWQQKDWKQYEIRIHAMKSTSKTIGAMELFELARMLEAAAEAGDEAYIEAQHEHFSRVYTDLTNRIGNV